MNRSEGKYGGAVVATALWDGGSVIRNDRPMPTLSSVFQIVHSSSTVVNSVENGRAEKREQFTSDHFTREQLIPGGLD
jgi:hypothetical protein